jgi:hypothetical protein
VDSGGNTLVRSRHVTIQGMGGVSHTVEVTAATLYEAVAQGLAAVRGNEWVAGIAQDHNVVKVSVADVRVEHDIKNYVSENLSCYLSGCVPSLIKNQG